MIITIQFSFIDLRRMLQTDSLLNKPFWISPTPYKEFVRGIGSISPRTKGGIKNWIGESHICKITRGLKFNAILIDSKNKQTTLNCKNISSHIFSDGKITYKYEFLFKIDLLAPNKKINLNELITIAKSVLNSQVAIFNSDYKYTDTLFKDFHEKLLNLHILTTTKNSFIKKTNKNLIKFCPPQFFFSLNNDESFSSTSKKSIPIFQTHNLPFKICAWWERLYNTPYKFWVVEHNHKAAQGHKPNSKKSHDFKRVLRISLLRYYIEHEKIKYILANLDEFNIEPHSHKSDIIQGYLNDSIKNISTNNNTIRNKIGINDFDEVLKEIYSSFNFSEILSLSEKISELNFRPQVEKKVINYIKNIHMTQNIVKSNNSQIQIVQNSEIGGNLVQETHNNEIEWDYESLAIELEKLVNSLKLSANSDENYKDISLAIQAKDAAQEKNREKIITSLKNAGKWILDTAKDIGVALVVNIIESKTK